MAAKEDNQNTFTSEIHEGDSRTIIWKLKNWKTCHKILADNADCVFNIADVKIRFFLCPHIEKHACGSNPPTTTNYYSLHVQILSHHKEVCLKVKTEYGPECEYANVKQLSETYVTAKKSAANQNGVAIVNPEFFKIGAWYWNFHNSSISTTGCSDFYDDDLHTTITTTLCQCIQEVDTKPKCISSKDELKNPIATQLQRLLTENPEAPFADVDLHMQDNVTIQGHRLLLASASPVFEAMFTSGLKETQTGIVEIPDVSSKVMKILIEYMYSGRVDPSADQFIEQVIYAASKYQLDGLVEYCDNTLITICNPGNTVSLLKLANKYNLSNAILELQKYTEIHALDIVMNHLKTA